MPAANVAVEQVAVPSASTGSAAHSTVPSSLNCTTPVGTGAPPLVTVAVKVTVSPTPEGVLLPTRAVSVGIRPTT